MPLPDQAAALREALVEKLLEDGVLRSPQVAGAMRRVPRHLFAPWLSLEEAYADQAWLIPGSTPQAPATISQPTAVALMLEGFALAPGQRVLEIGAGTGYNAALMAHIVGPAGRVVTVDIEAGLVETARLRLQRYANVQVVHGDGGHGYEAEAPYDRIVPNVGAWDLPAAWTRQLASTGQLVVPLHLSGEVQDHELIAFHREGSVLVGRGVCSLGMVLMRGEYAGHGKAVPMRRGPAWQGAVVQELSVIAYPKEMTPELQPHEKLVEKPSMHLVLSRREMDNLPTGMVQEVR